MEITESKCEFWDETVDPFIGCDSVGADCDDCWAMADLYRFSRNPKLGAGSDNKYHGLAIKCDSGKTRGTGEIRVDMDAFRKPLDNPKPTIYLVGYRGDLFHQEIVTRRLSYLHNWFNVMRQCPQHLFVIQTKRPENIAPSLYSSGFLKRGKYLPNVIFGISAGTQKLLDRRAFSLLRIRTIAPWPVLYASIEPMLEPINITQYIRPKHPAGFDWVMISGKTHNNENPLNPIHLSTLVNQCGELPVLFRGWGEWGPVPHSYLREFYQKQAELAEETGEDPEYTFPELYLNKPVIGYSKSNAIANVGRRKSGRKLNGQHYNGLPGIMVDFDQAREPVTLNHQEE